MPALSAQQILMRLDRNKPTYDQHRYDSELKRARNREATLCRLAQLLAARLGISLTEARRRVDAVAVTSRKEDDNRGNFAWRAYG
jgi:hypothetical protein